MRELEATMCQVVNACLPSLRCVCTYAWLHTWEALWMSVQRVRFVFLSHSRLHFNTNLNFT